MIFKAEDFPFKASVDYELPLQGGNENNKNLTILKIQKENHHHSSISSNLILFPINKYLFFENKR